MCGIVGVLSSAGMAVPDDKFITQGLLVDQLRGDHSTGVMYGSKDDHSHNSYLKHSVPGHDFIEHKKFGDIIKSSHNYGFMVGHNRYATAGALTPQNAHPFMRGHILMVHNGGLAYGWKHDYAAAKAEVDSDALAWKMSQVDDPKEVLESVDGAYALVWHNARDGLIRMARNSERPLWLCYNSTKSKLYFGSEKFMLLWLMDRNKIVAHADGPFELPVGTMMTFSTGKGAAGLVPVEEKFTPFRPVYTKKHTYAGGRSSPTSGGYNQGRSCRWKLPVKGTAIMFDVEGDKSFRPWTANSDTGYLLLNCWHWVEEKAGVELRMSNRRKGDNSKLDGDFTGYVENCWYDTNIHRWIVSIAYATIRRHKETDFEDFFSLEEAPGFVATAADKAAKKQDKKKEESKEEKKKRFRVIEGKLVEQPEKETNSLAKQDENVGERAAASATSDTDSVRSPYQCHCCWQMITDQNDMPIGSTYGTGFLCNTCADRLAY